MCGHIHKADIREDDPAIDIAYYNCGDWVESCTALVEHDDGRLEILDGRRFNASLRARPDIAAVPVLADEWPDVRMPFPLPSIVPADGAGDAA